MLAALLAAGLDRRPNPEEFRNPPKRYRPWTVWWWFGNASREEDLAYELAEMDKAGIGDAEINPVYPLSEDDPRTGIKNVPLFSAEWQRRFQAALDEAKRRGMKLILRAGSGWPLGGPWISRKFSSKAVARGFTELRGPGKFRGPLPPPVASENWTIDQLECVVAVNKQTRERVVIPRPALAGPAWEIPPGRWRLHAIYRMFTNQAVKRATLGGEGLVLDHFNASALELQLKQLEVLVSTSPGSSALLGIAADSLELDDSNWTDDFLAEFHRRRGYDLTPYLPDLWERLGPESNAVRQDFLQTLSELQVERYFQGLTIWAHKHGLSTNVQAHGTLADAVASYGAVDVPEGETIWPGAERYTVNLRHRRLAASAAHLYGKPVVSAESYTWLRMPRFLVSLALMKAASDAMYLDGINHIKNHGYSSSPRCLSKPGWVFYASALINHNQTWWPHYPALATYVARMNYLMQSARYVADIVLYDNLHDARAHYDEPAAAQSLTEQDAWHHHDRDPGLDSAAAVARRLQPCADRVQSAGYGFDVINDDALLRHTEILPGVLRGREASYRVLLFYNTESVPPAVLERAREFARAGGRVVAVGRLPGAGVGLVNMASQRHEIARLVEEIWQKGPGIFLNSLGDLQSWLDRELAPDFRVRGGDGEISFIHRRAAGRDIYFLANSSARQITTELTLRVSGKNVERWEPMNGSVHVMDEYRPQGPVTVIPITVGPWESTVLVFAGSGSKRADAVQAKTQRLARQPAVYPVEGVWEVSFGEPLNQTFRWQGLRDWLNLAETKDFSGMATYRIALTLASDFDRSRPTLIELGDVKESADVKVNGKCAGIAFLPPYRVQVTGLLEPGRNQLEIRVANLWSNYILSLPKSPSRIPASGYGLTDVLYGPSERPPLSSGLLGPVRVVQE